MSWFLLPQHVSKIDRFPTGGCQVMDSWCLLKPVPRAPEERDPIFVFGPTLSGQTVESKKPCTQAHLCVWAAQSTEDDSRVFWKHQVTTVPEEGQGWVSREHSLR